MYWHFEGETRSARGARRSFASFLEKAGVERRQLSDAELIFGELLANAVLHARGPLEIWFTWSPDGPAELQVYDEGPGVHELRRPASLFDESGRGLTIAQELARSLELRNAPYGLCATARLNLDPVSSENYARVNRQGSYDSSGYIKSWFSRLLKPF